MPAANTPVTDTYIPMQEIISLLEQLPEPITITPSIENGSTVFAWKTLYSQGTHMRFTKAMQAALETRQLTLRSNAEEG